MARLVLLDNDFAVMPDVVGEETYREWWVDETSRRATVCDGADSPRTPQLAGVR